LNLHQQSGVQINSVRVFHCSAGQASSREAYASFFHQLSSFFDVSSANVMSLDIYNRIKVIGSGSYGEVWLSKHKVDRKQVADAHNLPL